MMPHAGPQAYGVAVLVVALAALARWLLHPLLEHNLPFITFFASTFIVAWRSGRGPTLVAVRRGRGPMLLESRDHLVATGIATGVMGEQRLRSLRRAEAHAAHAEQAQSLA